MWFLNRDCQMSPADAPTETHKASEAGVVVTVCGLHHAGATLAAAHSSYHGIGGQVHPRPSGNGSHRSHIWRRGSVLWAGCRRGKGGGTLKWINDDAPENVRQKTIVGRLTDVTLRQHVGHYCSLRLLVVLILTLVLLVLRLVLRLIQGLVLWLVLRLRLRLRLRLGFSVWHRRRGRGGSGRALTSAVDPSIRALKVCVGRRRSNHRRLPGCRGLIFRTWRRVWAKKSRDTA